VRHVFANHDLSTRAGGELVDVTDDLLALVRESAVQNGMALVYSPHTTCAVLINEREVGFLQDFADALAQSAPEGRYYRHDDLERRTEGLEDDTAQFPNGHAHVRAGLLSSPSQAIPIVDGSLMLGRWQRVFLCELDRARPRKVFMQVLGE
jgi:secondary thiamine-phosphate synthase enzyme